MTKSRLCPFIELNTLCRLPGTVFSFDLDFSADCDDQYWAPIGGVPFKQPPGVPSSITFFNLSHRLNQISSFAMRTIVSSSHSARAALMLGPKYSINRSKALLGYVGPRWQQTIVTQLDSALNTWVDSIPDYCEPFCSTPTFPTINSSLFQCVGILQGRTACSSINPPFYIPIITKRRFSSIDHSYPSQTNPPCYPSPPWPSAQTPLGPVVI